MVLERLIKPDQLEGHPWELFLVGALYSNVGIIAAYTFVQQFASLTAIAFTTLLALPFVYYSLTAEEQKYHEIREETKLLRAHLPYFKKYSYFIGGIMLTFFIWHVFAPANVVETLFSSQLLTIRLINGYVTGNAISLGTFLTIFSHNVQVLMVCIILSFFFGTGAIYVLTWNASVLAAGMGHRIRQEVAAALKLGVSGANPHFLAYLIHGVPELFAYVIGGVIGGMLSVAYVKGELQTKYRGRIFADEFVLLLMAVSVLIVAGLLEVYVSPNFL